MKTNLRWDPYLFVRSNIARFFTLPTHVFVQDIHIRYEHVQLACHHLDLLKTHMWFLM